MSSRRPTRLPNWQEWAVYATLGLLFVSGVAWLVLDQWVRIAGEFGPEHHPAQRVSLIVHGIAAYLFLVVAGALIPVHIQLGWRIGRNRNSGATLATACMMVALSALGLYYFGGDISRHWVSIAHWSIGLALFPALLVHSVSGRHGG